jgi:hypothetical protein
MVKSLNSHSARYDDGRFEGLTLIDYMLCHSKMFTYNRRLTEDGCLLGVQSGRRLPSSRGAW